MARKPYQALGAQFASAASSRKDLESSLALSRAAIAIMFEALQCAETTLQTLSEIRIRTEALVVKAESGNATIAELKRELADWTFKSVDSCRNHESAMDDAWKGWRSAMAGIVRAGRSQKAHGGVLNFLGHLNVEYPRADKVENMKDLRAAMTREHKMMLSELLEVTDGAQDTLRYALKRLNGHKVAWEWSQKEMKKGAAAARIAIAGLVQKEKAGF